MNGREAKKARDTLNVSQEELAEMLRVSQSTVSRWSGSRRSR